MRRLLWTFGWVGVAFWSLICALAYGFFDLVLGIFMRNADWFSANPETVESIFKFFRFLRDFSTAGVLVVWGVTSLLILAVPWAFDRLLGQARRGTMPMPQPHPGSAGYGPGGVIDLEPGQYSVGPQPGPRPAPGAPGSFPPPAPPR
ncbi:hypothetical protein [Enterovirga rhinocerotis]|uniref:Uncharacterized protein n=1 Tax=Enterovirga rhinocerotis TaxID=1339210 RepID=A0A4R7BKT5_9HYPH|nr:hypothetical protein [Enterovirga rhinocerotis]TDR85202.1 hypothetical protein EV668_4747 [Enterovirga rhinocerotis]